MPSRVADAQSALERSREDALAIAERMGAARMRKLLKRAAEDLADRLQEAESRVGADSFTAVKLRSMLKHVEHVVASIVVPGMRTTTLGAARAAAQSGASNTVRYLTSAERAYAGTGATPLSLNEAAMVSRSVRGADATVLRRLGGDPAHPARAGILARYGVQTIGAFEEELQVGLVTGKSWTEMRDAITERSPFLQGKPAFWADRIVRTEVMGAHGKAAHESAAEAQKQLGDACKILSSTFDDRTGADSIAVHGQIRLVNQDFDTWFGPVQHPPDRPNDRGVLVVHRTSWVIPDALKWRASTEIAKRWRAEGRKGAPPERPKMTTIPLSKFPQR